MNKLFANIICGFVPKKEWRRKLRTHLTRDRFAELESKIDVINRSVESAKNETANLTRDRFAELASKIDVINRSVDSAKNETTNLMRDSLAEFETKLDAVNHNVDFANGNLVAIRKTIEKPQPPSRPTLHNVLRPMTMFRKFECTWLDRLEKELAEIDLRLDYPRLVSGLDSQSRLIVSRVLLCLRYAISAPDKAEHIPLFPDEAEELNHIYSDFCSNIVELAPDCFSYKGYLLPKRRFEVPVFWDRWTLPHVEHLDRLRNKDVIDAGAFIGDSALVLSDFTDGKVHAFEPASENYETMLRTIEMNSRQNIVPIKKGLGAGDESEILFLKGASSSARINDGKNEKTEKADFTSLDVYVAQTGIEVGIIKVDVEGFEQCFLRGAEQTIRMHRPVMLISIYHTMSDFFHIKPLLESWNLGYKFRIVKPPGFLFLETMLVAEPDVYEILPAWKKCS